MSRLLFLALVGTALFLFQQPTPNLGLVGENWEQNRALASLEIQSRTFLMSNGECQVLSRLRVKNVGALTFGIIGIDATFETSGDLVADWDRNSLLHTELSLGVTGFRRIGPATPRRTKIALDETKQTWYVVDPARTVDFSYAQPTRGSGLYNTSFLIETQPVTFDSTAESLTVPRNVRGVVRPSLPESGEGEVSDLMLYPYSASDLIVIPPGCWTDRVGPTPQAAQGVE
jgi:hypothetical protein